VACQDRLGTNTENNSEAQRIAFRVALVHASSRIFAHFHVFLSHKLNDELFTTHHAGAGYRVWWELVNARCLSAQSRNRLYFVGMRCSSPSSSSSDSDQQEEAQDEQYKQQQQQQQQQQQHD